MPDHSLFWTHVAMFILCSRLQICFDVASDETFAARVFRAYSAIARLRLIKQILTLRVVEERPMVEGVRG